MIKVRAKKVGYYGLQRMREGMEFTIDNETEFSDKWMEYVGGDGPVKVQRSAVPATNTPFDSRSVRPSEMVHESSPGDTRPEGHGDRPRVDRQHDGVGHSDQDIPGQAEPQDAFTGLPSDELDAGEETGDEKDDKDGKGGKHGKKHKR